MNIESIFLLNFRNYGEQYIELHPGLNIFYGDNAQGKTNIIEAVYLLTMGKSHRTNRYNELVKWNENTARVSIKFIKDDYEYNIDYVLKRNQSKQIKINGTRLNKLSDIIGNLNSVIFSPDHMKIIKEGPSERRKFIDSILSQVKPKYYYCLNQYLKVLSQRNVLLSGDTDNKSIEKVLDIWDNQLVEYGSQLIKERQMFVKIIDNKARNINHQLSGGKENLRIKYLSFINEEKDIKDIKEEFHKKLTESRSLDMRRGFTNYGPHRDDLVIYINDKEARNYGSQGQQRSVLLSLKLSEIEYIKDEKGSSPILLLDDVFSELDKSRQSFLISYIKDVQVILTCTDYESLNLKKDADCNVYNVINGKVYKK